MNKAYDTIIKEAKRLGYAIPAFNYSDMWELLAITEAAQEERAKVYIASNSHVVDSLGIEYCGALGITAYKLSGKTILNHLDHSEEVELCYRAVDNGYMSIMIDASAQPLEENIDKVKRVVKYAHAKGVLVEAEIGRIKGINEEGIFEEGDYLAEVQDTIKLVNASGVDLVAVGIGNAHGFYKGKPQINIERLKEINEAVSIPLVLHGSTGIPREIVRKCIEYGVAKVNVGTQLHSTYLNRLKIELAKERSGNNINDLFEPVKVAVKEVVKEWIEICMANNRY